MTFAGGLATSDQAVPSHCSTSGEPSEAPTAKQTEALGHATPSSSGLDAPVGAGLGTIAQVVPSQCSISVWFGSAPLTPTAKQLDAPEHAMPLSAESKPAAGLERSDQAAPSQRNAPAFPPIAKQLVVLGQAMPSSVPSELGTATTDQVVPFHRLTRLVPPRIRRVEPAQPTAKHSVSLAHATAFSSASIAPAGSGLGVADHAVPSHCSICELGCRKFTPLVEPTAKHLEVLGQAMPASLALGDCTTFGLATMRQPDAATKGNGPSTTAPAATIRLATMTRPTTPRPERNLRRIEPPRPGPETGGQPEPSAYGAGRRSGRVVNGHATLGCALVFPAVSEHR